MRVGYGRSCITPPLGTPCALGLEDRLVAVLDDLYVRTVYIETDEERLLLAAADLIGLYPEDTSEFLRCMAEAAGLRPDQVVLHATHTHQTGNSRWDVARLLEPYGLAEEFSSPVFRDLVVEGLAKAAAEAAGSRRPCEMAYCEAIVSGIASNRRVPTGDGDKVTFRSSRPPAELREKPEGWIDPTLRMVLFRSKDDGTLVGLANYSCHPSVAGGDEGPYATGDFPGAGLALAEERIGGARLLHLTGPCGEINPGKYVTSESLAAKDRRKDVWLLGARYADAILRAVSSATGWHDPTDLVVAWACPLELTVSPTLPEEEQLRRELEAAVEDYLQGGGARAAHGPIRRALYRYGRRLHIVGGRLQTTAAAARLGDVVFTFMPSEVFLQTGEELRQELAVRRPDLKLVNVSHCFDHNPSYIVPPEAFAQGGYEPTATSLAPEAYGELNDAMDGLLRQVEA